MRSLTLTGTGSKPLKLLFLGAHCDDIEIGCGGTLLKLAEEYPASHIRWVIFTSNEERKKESLSSAAMFPDPVKAMNVKVYDYSDGYLPVVREPVKKQFEEIRAGFDPDVIFTHYRNDLHQDHRIINELTWNTFRNHFILEYEIPKYDGDIGNPNFYIPLRPDILAEKIRILESCYKSQLNKHWFDKDLLAAILRLRGMECASESGYAEAFYSRKMIF